MTKTHKCQKALTFRQKLFCQYYTVGMSITEASLKAGYAKSTAASIGGELLKDSRIQRLINKLIEPDDQKRNIERAKLIEELKHIAYESCISNFLEICKKWITDDKGNMKEVFSLHLKEFEEIPDHHKKLIKKIKLSSDQSIIEFELFDRVKAMMALGRYFGLEAPATINLSANPDTPITLNIVGVTPEKSKEKVDFTNA